MQPTTQISKRCRCGASQKIYCSKCSKVKMCILLKNGNDHLKYRNSRGKLSNPVWYSLLKHNNKSEVQLIEGMLRRFSESPLVSSANMLIFYQNGNNVELHTHAL